VIIIVTSSAWPQADAPQFYAVSNAYIAAVTEALHAH